MTNELYTKAMAKTFAETVPSEYSAEELGTLIYSICRTMVKVDKIGMFLRLCADTADETYETVDKMKGQADDNK